MLPAEHTARLADRLHHLAQNADEATAEANALQALLDQPAPYWLTSIQQSLQRINLEAAEAAFAARQLRDALPATTALQQRLL